MNASASTTKQQVAELQVAGLEPAQISKKVGVTVGYISQLQNDSNFKTLLTQLQAAAAVANHSTAQSIDDNYNNLELKFTNLIVDNAELLLPQMAKKPGTLNQFMRTLNNATRRSTGEGMGQGANPQGAVVLELPSFVVDEAVPEVRHNAKNEVIAVQGQELVAMSGEQLAETSSAASLERMNKLLHAPEHGNLNLDTNLSLPTPDGGTSDDSNTVTESKVAEG